MLYCKHLEGCGHMEERVEEKTMSVQHKYSILQILVPDWTAKEAIITLQTYVLQWDPYLTEFYARTVPNWSIIFCITK